MAAPIMAWVVRILPIRILGSILTNMRTFINAIGIEGTAALAIYAAIVVVWISALAFSMFVNVEEKVSASEGQTA